VLGAVDDNTRHNTTSRTTYKKEQATYPHGLVLVEDVCFRKEPTTAL
jgi:hypothetical protein